VSQEKPPSPHTALLHDGQLRYLQKTKMNKDAPQHPPGKDTYTDDALGSPSPLTINKRTCYKAFRNGPGTEGTEYENMETENAGRPEDMSMLSMLVRTQPAVLDE